MDYTPIESSDEYKVREGYEWKNRPKRLLRAVAFILILLTATFIAASVILQSHNNEPSVNSAPHNTSTFRSLGLPDLPLESIRNLTFREPIGGRFRCSRRLLIPSPIPPSDANQVRPADIKYVAALGDSYLTGYLSWTTEMMESDGWAPNVVGNSFVTGGDGGLSSHLTLANILRTLNPSLVGYSTGIGLQESQSGLNVGIPGMWVDDMQRQARELIRRFRKYSESSIKNDWKLIHIFIGSRDIGGFCEGQGETRKLEYKNNITEAIGILQEALPKTIISIIGLANMNFLFNAASIVRKEPLRPCKNVDYQLLAQRRIDQYREANIEIVAEMGLKSRSDQVVIAQNLFDDLWEPLRKIDGSYNTDFYAEDLYHLSNYGQSLVAKQLWAQLVSPDHRKITTNDLMTDESPELMCPEYRCPFIRTPSNSINCVMSEANVVAGTFTDIDYR